MARIRVYHVDNLNGRDEALVAACNLKAAAAALGTTEYQVRLFGWRAVDADEPEHALAVRAGAPLYRKIRIGEGGLDEWAPQPARVPPRAGG
ncbi:hypothetical protein [Enterovirga aerilata]|uniref:Uncharacterized protein n=1 Tax=Enterovirga aerilata TaxID=2730920 RepID=A0A849IB11_9HYPH|nr:hypothetical protein [Enterovirga sp. DB1703]NNM75094.1 hypothetical protein [Enterovirga sp. DB1703]